MRLQLLFIDFMIICYSLNSNKWFMPYWFSVIPLFHPLFLSKIPYHLYTFRKSSSLVDIHTKTSHYSCGNTAFENYNFRFKKYFNIPSITDEHLFLFELSLGYLTVLLLYVFGRLLSFIKMHKFTFFLFYTMQAFPKCLILMSFYYHLLFI